MPAFRFKMQNILDIKEKLETQQKMNYSRANAVLMEEQAKLSELILRRKDYVESLKQEESGNIRISEIKFLKNAIESMDLMVKNQMTKVSMAQNQLEIERRKLDKAMQERKTYEKLKDGAFEEFKADIMHREAKETDELVAYSYHDNGEE